MGNGTGLIDVVITVTVLEGAGLLLLYRMTGKGVSPAAMAPNLLAGLFLVLALRGQMNGAPWTSTAAWLAASGLAHAADMWRRWRH